MQNQATPDRLFFSRQIEFHLNYLKQKKYSYYRYSTEPSTAAHGSVLDITNYNLYLAITAELWDVCCEYKGDNRPSLNEIALYLSYSITNIFSHLEDFNFTCWITFKTHSMYFLLFAIPLFWTGPHFNIKMSSYQYRDPHDKDKPVSRPSYL